MCKQPEQINKASLKTSFAINFSLNPLHQSISDTLPAQERKQDSPAHPTMPWKHPFVLLIIFRNACTEEKSSLVSPTIDNYLSRAKSSSLVQRFCFNWLDQVAIFLQTVFYNQSIIIFHRDKLEPHDRLSEKSYLNYTKNNCQRCPTFKGQYHQKKVLQVCQQDRYIVVAKKQ